MSRIVEPTRLPFDPPISRLVTDGKHNLGTFSRPVEHLNQLDAESSIPRAIRNLQLKEWQAFQITNGEWFLCGAVYSAKLLGLVQLIATHLPSGRIFRWLHRVPAWKVSVAQGLSGTTSTGEAAGFSLNIVNEVPSGSLRVSASHAATDSLPALELTARGYCGPSEAGHLVISHPFTENTTLYSNKCAMAVQATMQIGEEVVEFSRDQSVLIMDDHKGQYPAPMKYDWVTGASSSSGKLIAFNLTSNQIQFPELYNENAVWLGNEVHRLPSVKFTRPGGVREPWRIADLRGQVDVTFTPLVSSDIHLGPKRFLAEYYGPYGRFEGNITLAGGEVVSVDGFAGMGEQKFIRF
ncbi:MAG TPA: hypothetical protein DEG43_09590 [Acidimicrobiaceae bacterium]|nr:hypothetical protein [Acidimicrobiaceae bacterium]